MFLAQLRPLWATSCGGGGGGRVGIYDYKILIVNVCKVNCTYSNDLKFV